MRTVTLVFCLAAAAIQASTSFTQEWTRFRGPNGAGHSSATTIPSRWTERDFNWKISLPGEGHSSPVVWGDRLFLLSASESAGQIYLVAVQTNGTLAWQKSFPFQPFSKHKFNTFASPTPSVDAERVYASWATPAHYSLAAFTHTGEKVWERDLGPFKSQHGSGTSPILVGNKVILANEQDGESFILAVDAKSGQTVWQTPRRTTVAAYSTPCIYTPRGGKPALILNSQSHGIAAIDPDSGKPLWEFAAAFDKRSVSSPVVASDLLIGSCGSGGGGNYLVAVRPGDSASGREPSLAYTIRRSAPYVPTSVALENLLFLWGDGGVVTCLDAQTGEVKWQERAAGNFFASPVCVDRRLFAVAANGDVVVIRAADRFELLARNPLNETAHATPAIAGGRMYIRTVSQLVSIGGRPPAL